MNALRLAAICTVAALTGSTWAQNAPPATDAMTNTAAVPPAADVGGVAPGTGAGPGATITTHQQVYQDLVHSEQSGEQMRLRQDTYRGN